MKALQTEEEFDQESAGLKKIQRIAFVVSAIVFLLTTIYLYRISDLFSVLSIVFLGTVGGFSFAAIAAGIRIMARNRLSILFAIGFGCVIGLLQLTVTNLSSDIVKDLDYKEDPVRLAGFIIIVSFVSCVFTSILGLYLYFENEITKLAKLIRFNRNLEISKSTQEIQEIE